MTDLSKLYEETLPILKHQAAVAMTMIKDGSVDFDDLLQVGFFALTRAAEGFDESKGANFNTYLTWVLRNAFNDVVRKSNRNATSGASEVDENDGGFEGLTIGLSEKLDEVRSLLVNDYTITYFDARVSGLNDRQTRLNNNITNYRASQAREEIKAAVEKVSL